MVLEFRDQRTVITPHEVGTIFYNGEEKKVFVGPTTTSPHNSWEYFFNEKNIRVSVQGENWIRTQDFHAKCNVTYPLGQQYWCKNCKSYV